MQTRGEDSGWLRGFDKPTPWKQNLRDRGASGITYCVIRAEQLVGDEWADWYRLTPLQRWAESEKLWQTYLALGGTLDPEPDTQSPFFDASAPRARPAHGRPGLRILRRGRV